MTKNHEQLPRHTLTCRQHGAAPLVRLRACGLGLGLAWGLALHSHAATSLTSMSLEQLLGVNVVGASKYEQKQSEVAAAVSVITRAEIKAFGWRTIEQALSSLPGVYTTYDRQYQYIGMRGFSLAGDYNTRLLMSINGNRQNDPTYDAGALGRQFPLDMDLVERIEFIPGPGGAVYGQNAMFGVVNVITRTGAQLDGAEVAGSFTGPTTLREGRASWGKRLDNGTDVLLSASGMRSRGEDRLFSFGTSGISGIARGLDGDRDKEFFARVARGALSVDLVYGDHIKNDPTGAYLSDPLVPNQYQGDSYALAQLQYQDSFAGDTLQVSARLFLGQERYRSHLSYATLFSFPAAADWRGAELRLLSTAVDAHKLMLGAEFQDNRRIRQEIRDLANPANDIVLPGRGHRLGLYAQDEWHITDTFSTTLGLRVDQTNSGGTAISPRAALIWGATPATSLKALAGRAHRAPNAYERDYGDGFAQVANPALKGETIDTFELVVDHRVGGNLALRGSVYQWRMRDLITLGIDPVSGIPQYQSGAGVKARGAELSADRTWESGARLRGSLSMQSVAYAGGGALPNSPKLLGKINFSSPLGIAGFRLGYELQYSSKRLSLDGTRLGGYAVSNLRLNTDTLVKGLELSVGILNLFDKRYLHPGADSNWQNALEQDGRSVELKLVYKF